MLSSFVLTLISANIAVAIENPGEVDAFDRELIGTIAEQTIKKRTAETAQVVAELPASCAVRIACIAAILRETQASNVVLLQLVDAPTKIVVLAERVDESGRSIKTHRVDLPRERKSWGTLMAQIAAALFDAPPPPESLAENTALPGPALQQPHAPQLEPPEVLEPARTETPLAFYLGTGVGGALAVAGLVLLATVPGSINDLEAKTTRPCADCLINALTYEEAIAERDSIRMREGIALTGAGIGIAAVITSAGWMLLNAD